MQLTMLEFFPMPSDTGHKAFLMPGVTKALKGYNGVSSQCNI